MKVTKESDVVRNTVECFDLVKLDQSFWFDPEDWSACKSMLDNGSKTLAGWKGATLVSIGKLSAYIRRTTSLKPHLDMVLEVPAQRAVDLSNLTLTASLDDHVFVAKPMEKVVTIPADETGPERRVVGFILFNNGAGSGVLSFDTTQLDRLGEVKFSFSMAKSE